MNEPKKRGSIVRDRDGHLWKRGNTRWTCQEPVNGRDVQQVARLRWYALVTTYGPVLEQ